MYGGRCMGRWSPGRLALGAFSRFIGKFNLRLLFHKKTPPKDAQKL